MAVQRSLPMLTIFALVASARATTTTTTTIASTTTMAGCNMCSDFTGDLKPDVVVSQTCYSEDGTNIGGSWSADTTLATCQAAGGDRLEPYTCQTVQLLGESSPEMCASFKAMGIPAMCCDGDYTGTTYCNVCEDFSGGFGDPTAVAFKQCKNAEGDWGTVANCADCKAAVPDAAVNNIQCSYYQVLSGLEEIGGNPDTCSAIKSSMSMTPCCAGDFTGTATCDVCGTPTGKACMYRTPSGCPNAPQYAQSNWTMFPDPSKNSEEACSTLAAEGNAACGVSDVEAAWMDIPAPTEQKCLQPDNSMGNACKGLIEKTDGSGGMEIGEIDGDFADLAACKAAGGAYLEPRKCSMLAMYAEMGAITCDQAQMYLASSSCCGACPAPAPSPPPTEDICPATPTSTTTSTSTPSPTSTSTSTSTSTLTSTSTTKAAASPAVSDLAWSAAPFPFIVILGAMVIIHS